MKFSGIKVRAKQTVGEKKFYPKVELFSNDLLNFGEEKILDNELLFHGALSCIEGVEFSRQWDLRLKLIHLGDIWVANQFKKTVGYLEGWKGEKVTGIEHHSFNESYLKRMDTSPVANNVLTLKTEFSVVVLYHSANFNEDDQYPNKLRDIDNILRIRRTGGYNVYRLPLERWGSFGRTLSFSEFSNLLTEESWIISHWIGFGNI